MGKRNSCEGPPASNIHSFRCPEDLFKFAQQEAGRRKLSGGVSDLLRLLLKQLREEDEWSPDEE